MHDGMKQQLRHRHSDQAYRRGEPALAVAAPQREAGGHEQQQEEYNDAVNIDLAGRVVSGPAASRSADDTQLGAI
ncbi:MAG: hypothetical protein NVS3B5_12420 [Sphingomicrobium sp.]